MLLGGFLSGQFHPSPKFNTVHHFFRAMELSAEYIAGFFDGEGSISFATGKTVEGHNTHSAVLRLANSNQQVLQFIREKYGGTLHTYRPAYPNSRINHVLHIHKKKAKCFLQALVPHLVIKRNLAWIVLCFLERGVKCPGNSVKGHQGGRRLSADDLELRSGLHDLTMKINSDKGKPRGHSAAFFPK
jgi:hypothetical protein